MREESTPMDAFDGPPAERSVSMRWIWLLILLVLISILVAVAAFSPPGIWSASEIVVFVLTALLCTLVAISLGLTECREWLTRSEQSLQPIATQVRTILDLQTQLCEAVQQGNRELNGLNLQEEGNRHVLENRAAGLAGSLQAVSADVAALGAALQSQREATRADVAALAGAQGQWTNDIQKLQAALEAVAGGVAEIAREQAALRGTVQENRQILTATAGDIQQSRLTFQTGVESLSETGRQTLAAVTTMAAEQGAVCGTLQESGRVLAATAGDIEQSRTALRTGVDALAETGKQTIAALTTMAAVQAAVQETVRHTNEEIIGVGTRQTALQEAEQARAETVRTALAALSADQEQLAGALRQLHESAQAVAAAVTDSARQEASAHNSLQEVLTVAHQGVTAVRDEQTAVHESVRCLREEVTGVGARQTALGESMQSHEQAMTAATATLVAGQGQLAGAVLNLHELTQGMAGSVTDVAHRQAAACDAAQDGARVLTASLEAIQQGQRTLQREVQKTAEGTEQTAASMTALAAEQSTGRAATRRMIGEVANAAIAALALGHGRLGGEVSQLQALVQTAGEQGRFDVEPTPGEEPEAGRSAQASEVEPLAPGAEIDGPAETDHPATPSDVEPPAPRAESEADRSARLHAAQAVTHGEQIRYEAGPDRDSLGFWANANDWAEWDLDIARPGRFKVTAEIAALGASRFQVVLADRTLDGSAPNTGDYGRFQQVEVGTVELAAPGKTRVAVRPVPEGWQPMNLRSLDLVTLPV